MSTVHKFSENNFKTMLQKILKSIYNKDINVVVPKITNSDTYLVTFMDPDRPNRVWTSNPIYIYNDCKPAELENIVIKLLDEYSHHLNVIGLMSIY